MKIILGALFISLQALAQGTQWPAVPDNIMATPLPAQKAQAPEQVPDDELPCMQIFEAGKKYQCLSDVRAGRPATPKQSPDPATPIGGKSANDCEAEIGPQSNAATRERLMMACLLGEQPVKTPSRAAKASPKETKAGVSVGMTKAQVLNSNWGKPNHINQSVSRNVVREQWVYGGGNYLYFDNDVLTSIQTRR